MAFVTAFAAVMLMMGWLKGQLYAVRDLQAVSGSRNSGLGILLMGSGSVAASRRRQLAMPHAAAVSLQIGQDDRSQCGGLDPQIVKPGVFAAPHVVLAKKFDLVAGNRRHRS